MSSTGHRGRRGRVRVRVVGPQGAAAHSATTWLPTWGFARREGSEAVGLGIACPVAPRGASCHTCASSAMWRVAPSWLTDREPWEVHTRYSNRFEELCPSPISGQPKRPHQGAGACRPPSSERSLITRTTLISLHICRPLHTSPLPADGLFRVGRPLRIPLIRPALIGHGNGGALRWQHGLLEAQPRRQVIL